MRIEQLEYELLGMVGCWKLASQHSARACGVESLFLVCIDPFGVFSLFFEYATPKLCKVRFGRRPGRKRQVG